MTFTIGMHGKVAHERVTVHPAISVTRYWDTTVAARHLTSEGRQLDPYVAGAMVVHQFADDLERLANS
jgi:hypothetical protein